MDRREFLKKAGTGALGVLLSTSIMEAVAKTVKGRAPKIMIISGWQDVNIGDIAHTPALLGLLQQYMPESELVLWKLSPSQVVEDMLHKHYPNVKIVFGRNDRTTGKPDNADLQKAFDECDFFIHGSGPSIVAAPQLYAWHKYTHKPFGIFGVTLYGPRMKDIPEMHKEILANTSFMFARETATIDELKKLGLMGKNFYFVPDAVFGIKVEDEDRAVAYLKSVGLEDKKFICVIPRQRWIPYHTMRKTNWTPERIREVEEHNLIKRGPDLEKVGVAITEWVRKTGNKVLLCPEVKCQVDLYDPLIEKLPDDVKPYVIKRGYWMPDEAVSLYSRAHTLLSFDCHSPIMALSHGTPSFYLRQPEDTIKGQMYYDLGLADWVFEIEETNGQQIADRLMNVYGDYAGALAKLNKAMKDVHKRYDMAFKVIDKCLKDA